MMVQQSAQTAAVVSTQTERVLLRAANIPTADMPGPAVQWCSRACKQDSIGVSGKPRLPAVARTRQCCPRQTEGPCCCCSRHLLLPLQPIHKLLLQPRHLLLTAPAAAGAGHAKTTKLPALT